jgi:hypothetical protein
MWVQRGAGNEPPVFGYSVRHLEGGVEGATVPIECVASALSCCLGLVVAVVATAEELLWRGVCVRTAGVWHHTTMPGGDRLAELRSWLLPLAPPALSAAAAAGNAAGAAPASDGVPVGVVVVDDDEAAAQPATALPSCAPPHEPPAPPRPGDRADEAAWLAESEWLVDRLQAPRLAPGVVLWDRAWMLQ